MALGCTVRELLERIDSAELTEWLAFYRIEPWGSAVEDERAGVIAAVVHNNRGMVNAARESHLPWTYFPRIKPPVSPPTTADLFEKMRAATARMGGTVG